MRGKLVGVSGVIKFWRQKNGSTQDTLAKKVDIPNTTLAKMENGLVMEIPMRLNTLLQRKMTTYSGIN